MAEVATWSWNGVRALDAVGDPVQIERGLEKAPSACRYWCDDAGRVYVHQTQALLGFRRPYRRRCISDSSDVACK